MDTARREKRGEQAGKPLEPRKRNRVLPHYPTRYMAILERGKNLPLEPQTTYEINRPTAQPVGSTLRTDD